MEGVGDLTNNIHNLFSLSFASQFKLNLVRWFVALRNAEFVGVCKCSNEHGLQRKAQDLSSESVQGASLSLKSVDDVHGSDGLSASMLGVSDSISDDVLQENLQDSTGLLVDQS